MKALKITLGVVLLLMISVITFYTFNLVFTVVANHQALDLVSLSFLPMLFIDINMIALVVAVYRTLLRKSTEPYFFRYYGYFCGAFSLLTIIFSIVNGTAVYGSFTKDYVFIAYPLITLIVGILTLAVCIYLIISSQLVISREKPVQQFGITFPFAIRTLGVVLLLTYALERLGAFVLVPVWYSDIDGAVVIPYIIQLLMPALVMFNYALFEFMKHGSRKVPLISSGIVFGYSIFSLIYVICMSHNAYPRMINPLSVIQQFERLVVYPVDLLIMYMITLFMSGYSLANQIIKSIKAKMLTKKED